MTPTVQYHTRASLASFKGGDAKPLSDDGPERPVGAAAGTISTGQIGVASGGGLSG